MPQRENKKASLYNTLCKNMTRVEFFGNYLYNPFIFTDNSNKKANESNEEKEISDKKVKSNSLFFRSKPL